MTLPPYDLERLSSASTIVWRPKAPSAKELSYNAGDTTGTGGSCRLAALAGANRLRFGHPVYSEAYAAEVQEEKMPAIRDGDRIVVVDKKLFRDDNTRVFVGIVEEYDDGVVRARGSTFHLNPYDIAGTERGGEERVRIVSLTSDSHIYLLPTEVDITRLQLRRSPKMMVLTDGTVTLDLSDWLLRV